MDDQRRDKERQIVTKSEKVGRIVTAHSDALDLEPKVFEKETAEEIAKSLKRSAESSDRRTNRALSGQRCRC